MRLRLKKPDGVKHFDDDPRSALSASDPANHNSDRRCQRDGDVGPAIKSAALSSAGAGRGDLKIVFQFLALRTKIDGAARPNDPALFQNILPIRQSAELFHVAIDNQNGL